MQDVHYQLTPISNHEQFKEEYRGFYITVDDRKYKLYSVSSNYVMFALSIEEAKRKIDEWYKSR